MTASPAALKAFVLAGLGAPVLLLAALATPSFFRWSLSEERVGALTRWALLASFAALAAAGTLFLASGCAPAAIHLGSWFARKERFVFDLLIDGWSLGFAVMSVGICGVVSSFSFRYLHREAGFHRYFILLVAFVVGILLVALAGSIEVLFAGWEILGLSSALLVAFFHDRPAPVENGFRVLAFYRIGDACMLAAAVLIHHWAGSSSLSLLFSKAGPGLSHLGPNQLVMIAFLLIAAAAAKSALLPFSTWLPRAMEGPTPSSAVYYGALSIHAGCFLLLRASPLIRHSLPPRVLLASLGAATVAYAALVVRVQTDVKSRLCFASLIQVGIIAVEIALGFQTLAFLHIVGNACYRLLQFLSAPNILHDLHKLENDLGGSVSPLGNVPETAVGRALYLFALERGFLDSMIDRWIVAPMRGTAESLDRLDRWLCSAPIGLPREDFDGA